MTANKMPEMPEALVEACWHAGMRRDIERPVEAYGRTCFDAGYLAGIEAARACIGGAVTYTDLKGPEPGIPKHNAYNRGVTDGMNGRREITLTNLTALEQEAKK